jgi:hypothetical protein
MRFFRPRAKLDYLSELLRSPPCSGSENSLGCKTRNLHLKFPCHYLPLRFGCRQRSREATGRYERSIAAWCTKHPALISPVWTQTAGRKLPNHPQASFSVFESRGRRRDTGVQRNTRLTSGFSARRRATADPEEPDPQTIKSYCGFRLDLSLCCGSNSFF